MLLNDRSIATVLTVSRFVDVAKLLKQFEGARSPITPLKRGVNESTKNSAILKRDSGRRGGNTVTIEIDINLIERNAESIRDRFNDTDVGLMRDHAGDVLDGKSGLFQRLLRGAGVGSFEPNMCLKLWPILSSAEGVGVGLARERVRSMRI